MATMLAAASRIEDIFQQFHWPVRFLRRGSGAVVFYSPPQHNPRAESSAMPDGASGFGRGIRTDP